MRQEAQKTLALGTAWQATFDAKPFDEKQAKSLLDQVGDIGS